jgi:hypothetical protein
MTRRTRAPATPSLRLELEGRPSLEPGAFVNGFRETWPIIRKGARPGERHGRANAPHPNVGSLFGEVSHFEGGLAGGAIALLVGCQMRVRTNMSACATSSREADP